VSESAANGGDPFGLLFLSIISTPSLIVLGILMLGFKNRLQISFFNGLIPFFGIVALYIPLLVNGGTPIGQNMIVYNYWTRVGLIGTGLRATLSITTVVTAIAIFVPKRNERQTGQTE
jgi:hypothetical protein